MAEHYRFFDAVETNGQYDREYNAQEFTDYFKALVTTGVMKGAGNQLEVTANGSNMVTSVNTGIAFILGRYYENDAPLTFTHDTETLGLNRIDRIVIRMDQNVDARHVKAFLKKGTASTNPAPPTLTQNNTVYEISLAQVRVTGGQTFIASNAVTDERGTDVVCPWAGSKILPNFNAEGLQELIDEVESLKGEWIEAVLSGGYVTDEYPLKYIKDHNGLVTIFGHIKSPSSGASITTLPVGYRPPGIVRSISIGDDSIMRTISIYSYGGMTIANSSTSSQWINITFRTD